MLACRFDIAVLAVVALALAVQALAEYAGVPPLARGLVVCVVLGVSWWAARRLAAVNAASAAAQEKAQARALEEMRNDFCQRQTVRLESLARQVSGQLALTDMHQQRTSVASTAAARATESARTVWSTLTDLGETDINDQAERVADRFQESLAAVDEASGRLTRLTEQTGKIAALVATIEAIAKRTSMVALNATIEAARAGELGRGFAVVAVEVKNLAAQTAEANAGIRAAIDDAQAAAQRAGDAMQATHNLLAQGHEVAAAVQQHVEKQRVAVRNILANAQKTVEATQQATDGLSHALISTEEIRGACAELRVGLAEPMPDKTEQTTPQ